MLQKKFWGLLRNTNSTLLNNTMLYKREKHHTGQYKHGDHLQTTDVTLLLFLALVRSQLECFVQFWASYFKKDQLKTPGESNYNFMKHNTQIRPEHSQAVYNRKEKNKGDVVIVCKSFKHCCKERQAVLMEFMENSKSNSRLKYSKKDLRWEQDRLSHSEALRQIAQGSSSTRAGWGPAAPPVWEGSSQVPCHSWQGRTS